MSSGLFVTGTDTGVGKTTYCARLLRTRADATYWKPVQTGNDDDTRTVGGAALEPVYRFRAPQAPLIAAAREGARIDPARVLGAWSRRPAGRFYIVEGAGGLHVPLTETFDILDLIVALGLPTVVVARAALGTLNHALLTHAALRARGVRIHSFIFAGALDPDIRAWLQTRLDAPLEEMPWTP